MRMCTPGRYVQVQTYLGCAMCMRMCTPGRYVQVQTYLGCLACHRPRKCPPERGWPVGERVSVRELMGLSSPWYFGAVPTDAAQSARCVGAYLQPWAHAQGWRYAQG